MDEHHRSYVGGGLPRYRPETSFTFETGDIVYMY